MQLGLESTVVVLNYIDNKNFYYFTSQYPEITENVLYSFLCVP